MEAIRQPNFARDLSKWHSSRAGKQEASEASADAEWRAQQYPKDVADLTSTISKLQKLDGTKQDKLKQPGDVEIQTQHNGIGSRLRRFFADTYEYGAPLTTTETLTKTKDGFTVTSRTVSNAKRKKSWEYVNYKVNEETNQVEVSKYVPRKGIDTKAKPYVLDLNQGIILP